MKSPFPGMDPYIEACKLWGDFHKTLMAKIKESLARVAPPRYLVRTEERSYLVLVEPDEKQTHAFAPDVRITTKGSGKRHPRRKNGTAILEPGEETAPYEMRALVTDEFRESFVEIYDTAPEQRLVTSIEVLSPSNKQPNTTGWERYLRKRQALLLEYVNLVEIDLLRGGQRMPMFDPWPAYLYTALVARAGKTRCQVWPGHFRTPLPTIPVPLSNPDPDLHLDLQRLVDITYAESRYDQSIDYTKPLKPPLSAEDTAWFKKHLRELQGKSR